MSPRDGRDSMSIPTTNIAAEVGQHPELLTAWRGFTAFLLRGGKVPARDRELVILRIAAMTGCDYEWGHHVRGFLGAGGTKDELPAILVGPSALSWSAFDRALMDAAAELRAQLCLTPNTLEALSARYDRQQLLEVVFLIGHYFTLVGVLATFEVQLDDGLRPIPRGDVEGPRSDDERLIATRMEAMAAQDLDAVMSYYDDRSVLVRDGNRHVGIAEIRATFEAMMKARAPGRVISHVEETMEDGRVRMTWTVTSATDGSHLATGGDLFTVAGSVIREQVVEPHA